MLLSLAISVSLHWILQHSMPQNRNKSRECQGQCKLLWSTRKRTDTRSDYNSCFRKCSLVHSFGRSTRCHRWTTLSRSSPAVSSGQCVSCHLPRYPHGPFHTAIRYFGRCQPNHQQSNRWESSLRLDTYLCTLHLFIEESQSINQPLGQVGEGRWHEAGPAHVILHSLHHFTPSELNTGWWLWLNDVMNMSLCSPLSQLPSSPSPLFACSFCLPLTYYNHSYGNSHYYANGNGAANWKRKKSNTSMPT